MQVDAVLNLLSTLVCDQEDQPSEPVSILFVIIVSFHTILLFFLENTFRNFHYDVSKNIDYKADANCCCLVDVA